MLTVPTTARDVGMSTSTNEPLFVGGMDLVPGRSFAAEERQRQATPLEPPSNSNITVDSDQGGAPEGALVLADLRCYSRTSA
ncbi:MAG: hypothetical protein K1X79_02130 [Oligoflexia bacterium]|nr:hypothetical protein [Oligoflexia bacterium]